MTSPIRLLADQAPPQARTLPADFWDARASLLSIREAAHNRTRSADAVLAVVLSRLAAMVPARLKLPPIVGSAAPLSFLVALEGPPGSGKGGAHGIGAELLPFDARVNGPLPIGTGEGIAEGFYVIRPVTDDRGKTRPMRVRGFDNVFAHADEGEVVHSLADRKGSTLLSTLRTIFTGGTIGQANASEDRRRIIDAGSYAAGVSINLQPELSGPLLVDVAAGTPQRFFFASTIDPTIPEHADWPAGTEHLFVGLDQLDYLYEVGGDRCLGIPDRIATEVRCADRERVLGIAESDPWDAHADLVRLKLAALLALLDGHVDITIEDWELAQVAKGVSDSVRDAVRSLLAAQSAADERRISSRLASRRVEEVEQLEARKVQLTVEAATHVAARVSMTPGATASAVRRLVPTRFRDVFTPALDHAIAVGWVEERSEPGQGMPKRSLYPGQAQ